MNKKYSTLFLLPLLLLCLSTTNPPKKLYDIKKRVISDKAMVVSAHPLASKIGMDIIKAGGNAVDAAIAVHFALSVVYPGAGNIGGGGFMLIRMSNGETSALDFREKAPAAAHRDMYLDAKGNVIQGKSMFGHLAAGVPGTVDGMFKAYEKYSKLKDMNRLIQPSINLAAKGFRITFQEKFHLMNHQEMFKKYNTQLPAFVKNGGWQIGDTLIQKDLAHTLNLICEKGEAGFYEGETADKIVAEMKRGGGIITHEDLKNYESAWRNPMTGKYKGYELILMPPPSSGGILMLQMLGMVEKFPLSQWGFHSKEAVHVMVEAEKRAYADRAQHMGDADFYPVPVKELTSPAYIEQRMKSIDLTKATPSTDIKAGVFKNNVPQIEETTHFSIVDNEGNAVSCTTTLNGTYGSQTVVGGAGFLLNNEMDDFSVKPGVPNMYGAIGGEANAIKAGKRMLSSMTPMIVTKNGGLFMVVGTPGGTTIPTSVFQTFLNVVEFKMGAFDAVKAKRFHHQWLPDHIFVEPKSLANKKLRADLTAMGHKFKERENIGRVECILKLSDGRLEGGADNRADDHAEGW